MPLSNRAGLTQLILASPLGFATAGFACLDATMRKVDAVLISVANFAKRLAVLDNKTKFGKVGPSLNVVSVQPPSIPAPDALKSIASKHGTAPFAPFRHKPRSFVMQRLAALPVRGQRSNSHLSGTASGAKLSSLVPAIEILFAITALPDCWRVATCPARLAAKLRRCRAVLVLHVVAAANCTHKSNAPPTRGDGDAFDCHHFSFGFRPTRRGSSANRFSWASVIEKFLPMRSPSLPCRQYLRTSDSSTPRAAAASAVVYRFVAILAPCIAFNCFAAMVASPANLSLPAPATIAKHRGGFRFTDHAVQLVAKGTGGKRGKAGELFCGLIVFANVSDSRGERCGRKRTGKSKDQIAGIVTDRRRRDLVTPVLPGGMRQGFCVVQQPLQAIFAVGERGCVWRSRFLSGSRRCERDSVHGNLQGSFAFGRNDQIGARNINAIGTIASGNPEIISGSPAYCDVIVQRWENLTGKKAELATEG